MGDVPITDEGIKQAEATARHLSSHSIARIFTSPLRRAKETAEYISLTTKAGIEEDSRLRERANWGDLPEQTFDEFIAMWERSTADPEYIPPVGDSARQAGARLSAVLADIADTQPPDSVIALVTHGGLITDFLVHSIPENQLNVWHPNFVAAQSYLIPECSITALTYDNGNYTIQSFASVDHLD